MIKEQARQILNHYGLQHQKAKTIEELADVHIMITQLLDDEADKTQVSLIVDRKLKRQIRRIEKEKENE